MGWCRGGGGDGPGTVPSRATGASCERRHLPRRGFTRWKGVSTMKGLEYLTEFEALARGSAPQCNTRLREAGSAPTRRFVLLLMPLTTGAVGMSLEVIAFRLYAPYFGYSIFVWGGMIAGVMAAMASGYYAGGWLADHHDSDAWLYRVILISSAYQFIMILASRPLL